MKVVEYTYPIIVLSVFYLICVCRDLYNTNDLQDVSLRELNESILQLKTSIIDHNRNNQSNKNNEQRISEKKNHHHIHHQLTPTEDIVYHGDKTKKNVKLVNNNIISSRKASHGVDYDKLRHDRKSFDTAKNTMNLKKDITIEGQHKSLLKETKHLHRNYVKSRELVKGNLTTIDEGRFENNFTSGKDSSPQKEIKNSREGFEKDYNINRRFVESYMSSEKTLSKTSCVLTSAELIPACDDDFIGCKDMVLDGYCTDDNKDLMIEKCRRSCDACPYPVSLFKDQVQYEVYENIITTFNLSLDVNTDNYPEDTSWILSSQDNKDSIVFNSSDVNSTFQLVNNEHHMIQYNCIISRNEEHDEEEFSEEETTKSICYDFEVHDSFGDGMCCKYGRGSFSMIVNTNGSTSQVNDNYFHEASTMSTSFCINQDDNDWQIKSDKKFIQTSKNKPPSHYPFRWQCKNVTCLCDSTKPQLSANNQENHAFLFEVTMLSDAKSFKDVESVQYKAACWVLYDDPYKYDGLADERVHGSKIQRYILALLYFSMSPDGWRYHYDFLSSHSECDWNELRGIECDVDGNVINIHFWGNNLGGTIVDELSGLRMLESLSLSSNNIHGTISLELGRLSELRHLNLSGNDLEGTIPPQLFDAINLGSLRLDRNKLEGSVPEAIGNLQKLYLLDMSWNSLSGSIPFSIYTLNNLKLLYLNDNKLSSSISPRIGNLKKLIYLDLHNNMLTGQIPPTIGNLSLLERLGLRNNRLSSSIPSTTGNMTSLNELSLHNNRLSGPIPESLFDLPSLRILSLQDNSVLGSIPDEFCDNVDVKADCRNDVFEPEVNCSCCLRCTDETPTWDDGCADATIKVLIYHTTGKYGGASSLLEWSLTNDATGNKILFDGPYLYDGGLQYYEACVAYSDCFSLNQISPPHQNTNYTIYWNNNSIHNGTFLGYNDNDDIDKDDPEQTLLSFQYEEETQHLASCNKVKLECDNKEELIILNPNTTKRIMYDKASKISGRSTIQDTSSPQSKALCWMLQNDPYDNTTDDILLDMEIIQRYILAILHFMSPYGLFGNNEYHLAEKHECNWNGITCKQFNQTNIVTGISLSSEYNQIINGTLIDELGSLQYLEVFELDKTQLHGTIPQSFSNLWSLVKLDLSKNKINGTMPTTLFQQLRKLEHLDLFDNLISGTINKDIGSHSRIRSLLLRNNIFTGSLPMDTFKHNDLEHLDIGENELSELDFLSLLKHENLKTLDISSNFFVGSLLDNTFTILSELKHFNISQNDFSGTILSTFPERYNITHFDIHANRFKGTIPLALTELLNIQHLNLQGNQLTGSLPSQLNQLKDLTTLVLSHNELKGSIPFDTNILTNINRLHLHSNKLSGEAPQFLNMTSYITDCGFPSDSLEPVSCSTCNTCCNSDSICQSKSSDEPSQLYKTLLFMLSIIGTITMCYALKNIITSNKYLESFFDEKVKHWNALKMINVKSIYHFLLMRNKIGWYVAFACGIFQTATLFLFVHSADIVNDTSDREYSMVCPANSLECEDSNSVSSYGRFIFLFILTIWLLRDIIGSLKLMLVSFEKRNIDFFFTSGFVFSVTMLSLWTSVIYIQAIAVKNTDMIKDAVVLLFVIEIDERLLQLVESMNPDWGCAIDVYMSSSVVYGGENLMISSGIRRSSETFSTLRNRISETRDLPHLTERVTNEEAEERETIVQGEHQAGATDESNP